ncbi:hypothetical protein N9025_00535 [Synechococcus sp. AH-707-B22]|nr:hypothetical protein [Synechococcus sp. AH-707-B22]
MTEPKQPNKPRALTYTEMMNGGKQQIDEATQQSQLEHQRRKDQQERSIEHLEQSFKSEPDQISAGNGI